MANRFMTEGYLKLYLYSIHAMNLVLGVVFLLLALLPAREGLFEDVVLNRSSSSWIVLLLTGIFLVFVSVFGLLATLIPTRLLVTLCWLFSLLAILEIGLAITISVGFISHKSERVAKLNGIFEKYDKDLSFKVHVDKMQKKMRCCGVENADYWKGNLTKSCCQNSKAETCKPWKDGCDKHYVGPIYKYIKRVCVAIFLIAWTEGFGAVCAIRFKKRKEKPASGKTEEVEHLGQPLNLISEQTT